MDSPHVDKELLLSALEQEIITQDQIDEMILAKKRLDAIDAYEKVKRHGEGSGVPYNYHALRWGIDNKVIPNILPNYIGPANTSQQTRRFNTTPGTTKKNYPLEQSIADFLKEKKVLITPITKGHMEVLKYSHHDKLGQPDELGETVYNIKNGRSKPPSYKVLQKIERLEGFPTIEQGIRKLLLETKGKFFEDPRWDAIHGAIDSIESRLDQTDLYVSKPNSQKTYKN